MIGITKADQLKHNKKPKVSTFGKSKSFIKKKSTKNLATTHEKDYLHWLHTQEVPCFACNKMGNSIEWHHVKEHSSDKKDHTSLIPLCGEECHRLGSYSVHGNPRWFRDTFPIESQREVAKIFYEEFKDGL